MIAVTVLMVVTLFVSQRAAAQPCINALCGRLACDGNTMDAYRTALPRLLACQEYAKPFYTRGTNITDEPTLRTWCLGGACGEAFNDIMRFHEIEANNCEVHYPERKDEVISGMAYANDCIDFNAGLTPPAFAAEMNARIAAWRTGKVYDPTKTAVPLTGAPTSELTITPTPTGTMTFRPSNASALTPPSRIPPTSVPSVTSPTSSSPSLGTSMSTHGSTVVVAMLLFLVH